MYHYTYWLQDEFGKAYIGVRSCKCNVYDDTYMSSSNAVIEAIKNGIEFTKSILAIWETRKDALLHEILLHDIFDIDNNPNFYNKAKQKTTKFTCSTKGFKHSTKTIELFKKQKSGKNNPNFGKRGETASAFGHRHSSEQKETMKNFGEKNGMYNKNHSEKSIQKMKDKRKLRTLQVNTPIGIFDSTIIAASALKVHPDTIRYRIKSKANHFNEYFYIRNNND